MPHTIRRSDLKSRQAAFWLASQLTRYPADDLAELLADFLGMPEAVAACEVSTGALGDLLPHLRQVVTDPASLVLWQYAYVDLFDRAAARNPLGESGYGKDGGMRKGWILADLAGFYTAFGLDFQQGEAGAEMGDHVAVQLQFYDLLLLKESELIRIGDRPGQDIVHDARRGFLSEHLGRFVDGIAERPMIQGHGVYNAIFAWARDLVSDECRRLDVKRDAAPWQAVTGPSGPMVCGACPAAQAADTTTDCETSCSSSEANHE